MSGSFSSYEDLYEDPEEVYAEEADSAGSKSQSTGGQARSSQGEQGSSSPPLILGLVAVEEPLMVSKDADVSSIDPTPASSKDLLPLTSGKISVPAVVEAVSGHKMQSRDTIYHAPLSASHKK